MTGKTTTETATTETAATETEAAKTTTAETRKASVRVRLLIELVTCAERGLPLPPVKQLAERLGCASYYVSMAMRHLQRTGLIEVVAQTKNGRGKRIRIPSTGAITAAPD